MNKRVARRRRRRPRPFAAQVTGGNRVEGGRSADRWRRRLRWISVSYGFLLWKVYQINVSPTAASTGNNSVRKAIAQKNKYFALCVLRFCVFSFFIMMKSSLPEGTLFPASCRGVPTTECRYLTKYGVPSIKTVYWDTRQIPRAEQSIGTPLVLCHSGMRWVWREVVSHSLPYRQFTVAYGKVEPATNVIF